MNCFPLTKLFLVAALFYLGNNFDKDNISMVSRRTGCFRVTWGLISRCTSQSFLTTILEFNLIRRNCSSWQKCLIVIKNRSNLLFTPLSALPYSWKYLIVIAISDVLHNIIVDIIKRKLQNLITLFIL